MNAKFAKNFALTGIAAALLGIYGAAPAADAQVPAAGSAAPADGGGTVFNRMRLAGEGNYLSIGAGIWTDDRPNRGAYDGMNKSGGYGLYDGDLLFKEDESGTWLRLKGRNLGLDDREMSVDWLRQGDIGLSVEYSRIPKYFDHVINTGVTGIGTTRQAVPTPSIGLGQGQDVELSMYRERYTAKFFKDLDNGVKFNLSFRDENKNGSRLWGRGGAAEFAAEPINWNTKQLEAVLSYSRDKWQLSGGYYGTMFNNANSLVNTTLSNNASPFVLSLPLSNYSSEVFVNGGYNFTSTLRGTFKASYSIAKQDDTLTIGTQTGLASPLAPTNLGGRLDTTLLEAGLTAKPMPQLSVVGNLRYRDFRDKTPVFGVVFTGTTPTVWNTPFSYQNNVGKLEATYRLNEGYSVLGGLEYNAQTRSTPSIGTLWVPFRARLDETTARIGMRKSMSETLNGSVTFAYSNRTGDAYKLPGDGMENNINPLNIADRQRDSLKGMVDWSPMDRLSLQFMAQGSIDQYGGQGQFGLQSGNAQLYGIDGSFTLTENWQLTAWSSFGRTTANEVTQINVGGPVTAKITNLIENDASFGVGMRGKLFDKLKVGANAEQFRTVNKYQQGQTQSQLSSSLVPVPDIENKLVRIKLFADYAIQKSASLRFDVIREQYHSNDWTWMTFQQPGASPNAFVYGTTTDGTSVNTQMYQNSTFFGARYIYNFQ